MSLSEQNRLNAQCPPTTLEVVCREREQMRHALRYAKEKLQLYRAQHSGEYVGGIEYTALIEMIDRAIKLG